jgi:hypothetical protein
LFNHCLFRLGLDCQLHWKTQAKRRLNWLDFFEKQKSYLRSLTG